MYSTKFYLFNIKDQNFSFFVMNIDTQLGFSRYQDWIQNINLQNIYILY